MTAARPFVDTNIVIYSLSEDGEKTGHAKAIVDAAPLLSTQVINETISVPIRKYGFTPVDAYQVAGAIMDLCEVIAVEESTVREAIRLALRYQLPHWDALVVAAALLASCDTIYTEDLQHGQVIEGRLTVVNPFL